MLELFLPVDPPGLPPGTAGALGGEGVGDSYKLSCAHWVSYVRRRRLTHSRADSNLLRLQCPETPFHQSKEVFVDPNTMHRTGFTPPLQHFDILRKEVLCAQNKDSTLRPFFLSPQGVRGAAFESLTGDSRPSYVSYGLFVGGMKHLAAIRIKWFSSYIKKRERSV